MMNRRVTVLASSSILFLAACGGTTIRDSDSGGKGGKSQGAGGVAEGNGGAAVGEGGTSAAGATGRSGGTGVGAGGRGNGGAPGAGGRTGAGGTAAAGRSGTGGAAGTGGAEPVDAGDFDGSPPRCNELASASPLSWGMDGGLVAYVDRSSLTAPRRYQHTRDDSRGGTQLTCTAETDCRAYIIPEINRVLQTSAVQSALAAHTLFGVDTRPSDGQVFRVSVGSGYLDVGTECPPSSSSCRPVLPEVQSLVDVLHVLDVQELRQPACTAVFGMP